MSSKTATQPSRKTKDPDPIEGTLELNFARTVPVDASRGTVAAQTAGQPVELMTEMGQYRATLPLRPMDLATLSFISQTWADQGRPGTDERITFSLKDLARAVYPPAPGDGTPLDLGGKNLRLVRESLSRLFLVEISASFEGTDRHGTSVRRQRRLRVLQETDIWSEAEREDNPEMTAAEFSRRAGARRWTRDTVNVRFSSWMVEQLQAGYAIAIDQDKFRRLNGNAQRIYAWIGMPPARLVLRQPARRVPMTPALLATFGINRSTPKECARALRDAGKKICAVDPRIEHIDAEHQPDGTYVVTVDFSPEFTAPPQQQLELEVAAD
ncbi:unannotated protein [freshwater metagenome]|uniref:Unannotated protein n=1 Tax=freshwater metagenome TaxID=449393 RepID=A0A6J7G6U3_9ZZZZ|nr:hypothetical protein [Actinomycetota bacterium]